MAGLLWCFAMPWLHALASEVKPPVEDTSSRLKPTVAWQTFLARHDLVWNSLPYYGPPPVGENPSEWLEGGFVGNGSLGMMVYKDSSQVLRFQLGSSEVTDISTFTFKGRPSIGGFLLKIQGFIQSEWMRQDLWNAELRGGFKTDKGTVEWRCFSHATKPLNIIEVTATGAEMATLEFRPASNSTPDRVAPDPNVTSVDGIHVCLKKFIASGEYATAWQTTTAESSHTIYTITTEAVIPGLGAQAKAITTLKQAASTPFSSLVDSHRAWWHDWYPKAFVSFPDPVWESFYWIEIYKLASTTRADKPMIDDSGVWAAPKDWGGVWWNLEAQLTYSPLYKANRLDLSWSLARTLFDNKANLYTNSRKFQADSAAIWRRTSNDCKMMVGSEVGNLTWALYYVWEQYRYSMDEQMGRRDLYPLLKRSVQYYMHLFRNDFIGSAEDVSGNGLNLTCYGVSILNRGGKPSFDFDNGYGRAVINQPDFQIPIPGTFTFWAYVDKTYGSVFSKGQLNKALKIDPGIFSIGLFADGIHLNSSRGKLALSSGQPVKEGQWHFCSVTISNDSVRFGLDGNIVSIHLKNPVELPDNTSPCFIGNNLTWETWETPKNHENNYDLAVDDFRIYNQILTGDKINLVQQGQNVPEGLLGKWSASLSKTTPRFQDKAFHLPPTISPEYGNSSAFATMDCNYSLAIVRWGLSTLLDLNARFGLQDPEAPQWRDTLDHLAKEPSDENGLMIGADVPYTLPHRHFSHLLGFWPLHVLPDNNVDMNLITRSLDFWIKKSLMNPEAFKGAYADPYSYAGAASMLAWLKRPDEALAVLNHAMGPKKTSRISPNTHFMEGGPINEAPAGCAEAIQEMLLQCGHGVISIFPAVPAAWKDATFHDLRADGAFLVSGVRTKGVTDWVRVKSLAGEPCIIDTDIPNPVQVGNTAFKLESLSPGRYRVELKKNDEVILARSGVTDFSIRPVAVDESTYNFWGSEAAQSSFYEK